MFIGLQRHLLNIKHNFKSSVHKLVTVLCHDCCYNAFVLTKRFNMRLTHDARLENNEIRLSVLKYSIVLKFYNVRKPWDFKLTFKKVI